MAFPADPQDLIVEAHLGGDWVSIVGDVRESDGIDIRRGIPSEGSRAQPSTCDLTLDNRSGNYSPRNPSGVYFGAVGRNTPLRVALGLLEDDFARTVASGWGSTASGQAWTTQLPAGAGSSTAAVGSGVATHTVAAIADTIHSYLDGAYKDVDVAVTVAFAITDVTGGDIVPGSVMVRVASTSEYCWARVGITSSEQVTLRFRRRTPPTDSNGLSLGDAAVTISDLVWTGQPLRVRVQAEGQTLRGKVWDPSGPEPSGWHAIVSDAQIPLTGGVGVQSTASTGNTNTPLTLSYDDFVVRHLRWAGEVSKWPIRSDVSGSDVVTSIQASGQLRRLGQGASPLRSALYRGMTGDDVSTPVAYWPCEDGASATTFASALGHGPLLPRSVTPAAWDDAPATAAIPTYGAGGYSAGAVPPYATSVYMRFMVFVAVPDTMPGERLIMQVQTAGSARHWRLYTDADGNLLLRATDLDGTVIVDEISAFGLLGKTGLLWIYLIQDGADVDWQFGFASNAAGASAFVFGDTLASKTFARATGIVIGSATSDLNGMAIGHVVVLDTDVFWDVVAFARAWTGESAGDRMVRLSAEEGVLIGLHGDPDDTPAMGPQGIGSYLDLMQDCANVDQGILGEPRGALGLSYRTRTSMYIQPTTVTLDYSAGELQPGFEPVDDDRAVVNEVTVSRVDGSSFTHVRSDGPLSVAAPPDGVGRYDQAVTVNVQTDGQVPDQAGWRVHLGTVDEPRYPDVGVNLAVVPSLRDAVLAADVGSRLVITDPPAWLPPDNISTLIQGYREHLSRYEHTFRWSLIPESPYRVGILDDPVLGKADTDGSELAAAVDSDDVTFSVAITDGPLWTTDPAQFPFDLRLGGEVVTVTAITGAGPQSFTVTRSINGVVKGHNEGTGIRLAHPMIVAL